LTKLAGLSLTPAAKSIYESRPRQQPGKEPKTKVKFGNPLDSASPLKQSKIHRCKSATATADSAKARSCLTLNPCTAPPNPAAPVFAASPASAHHRSCTGSQRLTLPAFRTTLSLFATNSASPTTYTPNRFFPIKLVTHQIYCCFSNTPLLLN